MAGILDAFRLDGKIAVVTGSERGLGRGMAVALAQAGADVLGVTYAAAAPETAAAIAAAGRRYVHVQADLSSLEPIQGVIDAALAAYGRIDILVNNAGITRDKFFPKMEKGQWDAVINTNLNSLFNVTHHVSAKMAERGWGRIINISSVNGVKGQAGQTNYSAAKAGVLGFTKALAAELASKGVTVNAIAPGYVGTEMVMAIREDIRQGIIDSVPMKRLGRPDEIGDLCAYLASDKAAYITGATININGGLHMC